jgi:hypothetical protein
VTATLRKTIKVFALGIDGDRYLAESEALAVELGQSPFLNVLSARRIAETLHMMGHPPKEQITADIDREVCERTGSKATIGGSISSLGSHFPIELNAVAGITGDNLAQAEIEATSKDEVLPALSHATSDLRIKLGESLPSVQKFEVPFEATTSSLEALESYSMGVKVGREKGAAASIPFLQQAIRLDPNFPMAYVALSTASENLSQPTLGLEYATKAYRCATARRSARDYASRQPITKRLGRWIRRRKPTKSGRRSIPAISVRTMHWAQTTTIWGSSTKLLLSTRKPYGWHPTM